MCQTKEKAMPDDNQKDQQNNDGDNKDMVSKADLDAALARSEKLEKDLEDVRMEVLTPEYQKFLDAADKPDDKDVKKDNATDDTLSDDKFEKMTKKEIFDLAVKTARDEISGTLTKKEEDAKKASEARTNREIAAFAKEHEDFSTFRPIMYGLSLDPKHADKTLDQLYKAAKEHVGAIHKEPTEKEKEKSRRSSNEKPGGDSSSMSFDNIE
jgi:hypothetical protein